MIEPRHPMLSISRQCALIEISRSVGMVRARRRPPLNLALMKLIHCPAGSCKA